MDYIGVKGVKTIPLLRLLLGYVEAREFFTEDTPETYVQLNNTYKIHRVIRERYFSKLGPIYTWGREELFIVTSDTDRGIPRDTFNVKYEGKKPHPSLIVNKAKSYKNYNSMRK